ncbi:MAG TPA: sigma-70 family RNA polymerase sigma factor [Candidatus Dormibacteraeota bacterium]|nr:sigma-70 family RNA polymerase sigma factor [Candidatus Dormibacteraeota bacterium]
MTGTRQGPVYRRRVRGAHKGLKRMLVEGMGDGVEAQTNWRGFSGSMVRQAVGEAVSDLPPRQRQLIKLAYFSDLTNREIAQGLGITLSSVERGLRQAIARVSDHVQRGRAAGRKAIYALAMFLSRRWWSEAHQAAGAGAPQWVKAGTLLIATAAAGAVLAGQPLAPASRAPVDRPGAPSALSATSDHAPPTVVAPTGRAVDRVAESAKATTPMVLGIQVAPPSIAPPSVPLPQKLKVLPPAVPSLIHGLLGA